MKKYFCVADVHSFYDEMMQALNEVLKKYTKE